MKKIIASILVLAAFACSSVDRDLSISLKNHWYHFYVAEENNNRWVYSEDHTPVIQSFKDYYGYGPVKCEKEETEVEDKGFGWKYPAEKVTCYGENGEGWTIYFEAAPRITSYGGYIEFPKR